MISESLRLPRDRRDHRLQGDRHQLLRLPGASRRAPDGVRTRDPVTQLRPREDVATAYVRSTERLLDQLEAGETGVESTRSPATRDPSVETVANLVADIAAEETGERPEVKLVENPRADDETLTDTFEVDTSRARERLGWSAERNIESVVREIFAEE